MLIIERDPKTFNFFQIELFIFVFRSSSELVSKFKNSVLVQKSIKSAIQRLLIFLDSGFTFCSDRALSWFLNSKILFVFENRSRARSKDINFFSDRALSLVFKFKNSVLVQKSNRARSKDFSFFQIELWSVSTFFQIELWFGF